MALVEPYAPCHCGSGQKYKWCCQSVEPYIERSQRLLDNGQFELAINPINEGLSKTPDNVSLLLRKALIQLHLNQAEQAGETLRHLLQKQPGHLGGSILMTRLAFDSEGVQAAIAQFQQALTAVRGSDRAQFAALASFLGANLSRSGYPAAAIKHFELAGQLSSEEEKQVASQLQNLRANPGVSLWEKNPYRLSPAPEGARRPSGKRSTRRWAGPGIRSGRRLPQHSSSWQQARVRAFWRTVIVGCAACGSRTMKGPSPRYGDTSRGASRPPTRSISKRSARSSSLRRGMTSLISIG